MEIISTVYTGNLRTETKNAFSDTKIITTASSESVHEEDFSPTDLFAISYASCALTILGMAAQQHGINVDGTIIHTSKVMNDNPRRIAELIVDVQLPHDNYSEKERKIIERSLENCPVANTVRDVVKIHRTIGYGRGVAGSEKEPQNWL